MKDIREIADELRENGVETIVISLCVENRAVIVAQGTTQMTLNNCVLACKSILDQYAARYEDGSDKQKAALNYSTNDLIQGICGAIEGVYTEHGHSCPFSEDDEE